VQPSNAPPKKPPRKKRSESSTAPLPIRKAPPPPPAPKVPPKNISLEKENIPSKQDVKYEEVDQIPPNVPPKQSISYEELKPSVPFKQYSYEELKRDLPSEQLSSYEEIQLNGPLKLKQTVSDSLIDFSNDCNVPILAPPPSIAKSQKCLPNVPYNPFDDVLAEVNGSDVIGAIPLLQPISVNNCTAESTTSKQSLQKSNAPNFLNNQNWATFDSPPQTNAFPLLQPTLINGTDQNIPKSDKSQSIQNIFPQLKSTDSNEENKNSPDFSISATDKSLLDASKPRKYVVPNHYVKTDDADRDTESNNSLKLGNPFFKDSQTPLYPSLFSSSSDNLVTNGFTEPGLTPTAPVLTRSMVRKDAENIQNELKRAVLDLDVLSSNGSVGPLDLVCSLISNNLHARFFNTNNV